MQAMPYDPETNLWRKGPAGDMYHSPPQVGLCVVSKSYGCCFTLGIPTYTLLHFHLHPASPSAFPRTQMSDPLAPTSVSHLAVAT